MTAFVLKFALGLFGALMLVHKLRGGRRIDKRYLADAVFTALAALAFAMVGSAAFAVLTPLARAFSPAGYAALLLFAVGYVGFAALWIARFAPKGRTVPAFVTRGFGAVDLALIAVAVAGVAALVVYGHGEGVT